MNPNLALIIEVCNELGIKFTIVDKSKTLLKIGKTYFMHCSTPLNNQTTARSLKDKDFTYKILKDKVNQPFTKSYLDPFSKESYQQYVEFKSYESISNDIKKHFQYPLIIKRNSGEKGINVYKVQDDNELMASITEVFKDGKHYDYILLAQEYIEGIEIRSLVLNNNLKTAYYRSMKFNPKSEHERFIEISDSDLINKIELIVKIISQEFELGFVAVDLMHNGNELTLVEINTSPNLSGFTRKSRNKSKEIFEEVIKESLKL
jgi:glutathione synthase/RimK-type ligase-like ATP-grasp enzyme